MKPFTLRFAVSTEHLSQGHVEPMAYDSHSEMMLLVDSPESQPVIDRPSILMATGSSCTKADGDPTLDESTDR